MLFDLEWAITQLENREREKREKKKKRRDNTMTKKSGLSARKVLGAVITQVGVRCFPTYST